MRNGGLVIATSRPLRLLVPFRGQRRLGLRTFEPLTHAATAMGVRALEIDACTASRVISLYMSGIAVISAGMSAELLNNAA